MNQLRSDTVETVLQRLGFSDTPPTDLTGLTMLYRSWCRSVPFDNTLKLIALHEPDDGPLPGMDAESFFASWLRHGTGGTCWPSNNALHSLVQACGFDSRMIAASMADPGVASHGTTIVTLDDGDWLIDSSMLTDEPLQLSTSTDTTIEHAVFTTSAQPVAEGWLFQFSLPYTIAAMPCRTIAPAAATHDFCVGRFEASREMSPFNQLPCTRRNDAAGVVSYGGGKRYRRTDAGVEESDLTGNLVFDALRGEFAMSEEIVSRLESALDSTG